MKYFIGRIYTLQVEEVNREIIIAHLTTQLGMTQEEAEQEIDNATKEKATLQFDMRDGHTYEAWAQED